MKVTQPIYSGIKLDKALYHPDPLVRGKKKLEEEKFCLKNPAEKNSENQKLDFFG